MDEQTQALYETGKFAECEKHLLNIISTIPTESDDFIDQIWMPYTYLAMCYKEMDQPLKAIEILDKQITLDSEQGDPHYKKACMLEMAKDQNEALKEYSESIRLDWNVPDCYYFRGLIFQHQEKFDDALKEYDLAWQNKDWTPQQSESTEDPFLNKFEVPYQQSNLYIRLQQYDKAEKVLNEVIELMKQLPKYDKETLSNMYVNQARIQQHHNNADRVFSFADLALSENQKNTQAVQIKVNFLKSQGKINEAMKLLEQLPQDSQVINERGTIFFIQGNYTEAKQCFEKVLEKQADSHDAKINLALCFKHLNKKSEAEKLLKEIIDKNEKDLGALINYGSLLDDQKKYDEAIDIYKKAIQYDEKNTIKSDAYNNMGVAYKNKKLIKEALESFTQAVNYNNKYILAYSNKAQLEFQLGQGKEALESLTKAKDLLTDTEATSKLTVGNLQFIGDAVKKIIELETKFSVESKKVQEAIAQNLDRIPENMKKEIEKDLQEIDKLKQEATDKQFKNIENQANKVDEPNKTNESPTKQDQSDDLKKIMEMMMALQNKVSSLEQESAILKKEVDENKSQIKELEKENEKLKEVLLKGGVYESAQIKSEWENIQKTNEDLYQYTKSFYWTLMNYIAAYRVSSSGAFQKNLGHTESQNQSTGVSIAKSVVSLGAKIASNLPFVGGLCSMINGAIDAIYTKYKKKAFNDRETAINKIIMHNNDPNAQMQEEQSRMIAMCALELAKRKEQILNEKREAAEKPVEKGKIGQAIDWIKSKISQLKEQLSLEEKELYKTVPQTEALQDVTLLLIYMTANDDEILNQSSEKALYLILADAVFERKIEECAESIDVSDETSKLGKNVQNEAFDAIKEEHKEIGETIKQTQKEIQTAKVSPEQFLIEQKEQIDKSDQSACCILI